MKISRWISVAALTAVIFGISAGSSFSAPTDYAARNLRVTADTKATVDIAWGAQTSPVQWRLYRNGALLSTAGGAARTARFGVNVNNSQYVMGIEAVLPDTSRQLSTITVKRWAAIGTTEPALPPDDTSFPVVSITSPVNGATVSGTINVAATASDNVGVVDVQFKVDGTNIGSADASSPYAAVFNTTTVADGNHNLTAIARDLAGNVTTSVTVVANVNNTPQPPPPGAQFTIGETAIGSTVDSGNGNMLLASRAALDRIATVKSLSFHVRTASGQLRLGLYYGNGPNGGPGTKAAVTPVFTPMAGWNTVNVVTPVALAAGDYWIAYNPSSSALSFSLFSGGQSYWSGFAFGELPDLFPSNPGGDTVHWSMYATLNEGGTPVPPPPPPANPQCSDTLDNDGDGFVDFPTDPGCANAQDNNESDDPPPPPPGSVTLQQVDGGLNYYGQFSNPLPTSANFFPIAVWGAYAFEDSNVAKDKAVGINTYIWAADPSAGYLQNIREAGMYAYVDRGEGGTAVGSETVGRLLGDEVDMTGGPGACPSGVTETSPNDGRARIYNYGKGVLNWGASGFGGHNDTTSACFINHPLTDIVSTDLYWHTDSNELGAPQSQKSWGYGWNMERVRMLDRTDGVIRPQWGPFVEVGNAMNGSMGPPTPEEIRGAVWHGLIKGSRAVEYFQHDFSGDCITHHALRETGSACYGAAINMVTGVNAQVTALAPVLNSPFVNGGRTVTGPVEHMIKWNGSNFYVFAGARAAGSMNFTMSCLGNATATRLAPSNLPGEAASIPVTNGVFTDSFATENSIHIYRIDGGSSCGLNPNDPPPTGGFPDASNTGPSGALAESTGNVAITTAGFVLQNRKINGCVDVLANNVIIRNVEIHCGGSGGIDVDTATGLVIEDSIIHCVPPNGHTAVSFQNYTIRRSELYGCENILWAENNVLIEDNYIHDTIPYNPATDPHTDGIQMPTTTTNVTIRHNTVYGGYIDQSNFGNSAITSGESINVVVTNNLLAGGGYTLYCPLELGGWTLTNNRFSRIFVNSVGGFGPASECSRHVASGNVSGNVYHETGQPIPLG